MNRVRYIVRDAVRGLVRDWKMNLLFAGVLFGSMLLAIYCIASIRFLEQDLKRLSYPDMEQTVEACLFAPPLDRGMIDSMLRECRGERASVYSIKETYLPALNGSSWFVAGIDETFPHYRKLRVKEGSLPGFSGRAECVIGSGCADKNGLAVGDALTVDGVDATVVGITKQREFRRYIFLPFGMIPERKTQETLQQFVLLTGDQTEPDQVRQFLEAHIRGEVSECGPALDIYRQNERTIRRWIRLRMVAGGIGMLFAVFNILSVCFGKIQEKRKEYLTKQVLGLTGRCTFLAFFVENFLTILISCGLAWTAFGPLTVLLDMDTVVLKDGKTAAVLFILAVLFSLFYSSVLTAYLKKCPVTEMLKEGN